MTTEIRDPQFAIFVDDLADSLTTIDLSLAVTAFENVAAGIVAFYDAFATPEPGTVARASEGYLV